MADPSQSVWSRRGASALAATTTALALLTSLGCERPVARDELGTVVFQTDELPGAGAPYKRPEMAIPTPPPPSSVVVPPEGKPSRDIVLPGAIDELE